MIRCEERDALQAHLKAHGVEASIHYPVPVHMQPAYRGRLGSTETLPETERAAREILSLPMYPELTADDLAKVIGNVKLLYSDAPRQKARTREQG